MSTDDTPGHELELRAPVLEAELVDDDPAPGRAVERWRRVTLVPPRMRNPALVRQTIRDAAVTVLLVPWRTLRAVVRGLVHAARGWRRWVRVHDYRDAAEQGQHAGKMPDFSA